MNSQIFCPKFKQIPSKIVEELIFIPFSSSILVKIEASSKKRGLSKSPRKQKVPEPESQKFIQCSTKVSFQCQSNLQKYKNPNKITIFTA